MKTRKSTGIPDFKSLDEERTYWESRAPLAAGNTGRMVSPRQGQKRTSFLAIRLTGEELTRLRDVAAKQGLGPSTFARAVILRTLGQQRKPFARDKHERVVATLLDALRELGVDAAGGADVAPRGDSQLADSGPSGAGLSTAGRQRAP